MEFAQTIDHMLALPIKFKLCRYIHPMWILSFPLVIQSLNLKVNPVWIARVCYYYITWRNLKMINSTNKFCNLESWSEIHNHSTRNKKFLTILAHIWTKVVIPLKERELKSRKKGKENSEDCKTVAMFNRKSQTALHQLLLSRESWIPEQSPARSERSLSTLHWF